MGDLMMSMGLLLAAVLVPLALAAQSGPVIGILSNPTTDCGTGDPRPGSCFNTLYVDWLQSAGARVTPILYDSSPEELDRAFASVNGILLTGGNINQTDFGSPYLKAARRLLSNTVAAALRGDWVPIWGTCQGFQLLLLLTADDPRILSRGMFDAEDLELPLNMTDAAKNSRMFGALPHDVLHILTNEPVTENLHHDGVTPESFHQNHKMRQSLSILSQNNDRKGKPFISTIEGKHAPIYGVQWHPERSQFQFDKYPNINHGQHAVRAMQWSSNFFVNQSRMIKHAFGSAEEESAALIYNYKPEGNSSTRIYYFK